MRVLCSFVGGAGHLLPQLPLLRAFAAAGGELTLVGRVSATRAAPDGVFERVVSTQDRRARRATEIGPLGRVDRDAEIAVVADHFAGAAARRSAERVAPLLPGTDLLVCDELDFGAMAAAQGAGIPVVVVAVLASGALVRGDRIRAQLDALGGALGLSDAIRWQGDAFVVPFAPSLRDPGHPAPPHTLWLSPDAGASPDPDGSVVATLGTEFNTECGDLFERILAALADLGRPSVLAIGSDLDPARFGPQPGHVQVRRYVDLPALAARASAVIHHGGSGMLVASVLGGAPQVVLPMGADQPFNADRVSALGLGTVLDVHSATPSAIRDSAAALLADSDARMRVGAVREELLGLPSPADVAEEILRGLL
ncbi:glycosyl transferase [Microbacterium barkeri]|uniref:Glycosyl transferase n=1 Tax=Microbacterium barkeri TaxID=33917 RepID=A0A9W6H3S4_9MICO|nr:glycosyltransferase [Microbacterium barkeri]MDR6875547.1 hypothetical protein [Microbacterium barkeri]GLJ61604.1 glycosyl transferase [Microbacterium barkeri]